MQTTLFDLMSDEDREVLAPKKSTDWKWTFSDYPVQKNGLKVFSCFACGGGSTMGYKLAGCDVIGCCEIDPKMNEIYVENHHPKYNYLMDIREFNKLKDLPDELYNLDILDGSPPCTTFSVAGLREETWGKEKKFREGQVAQTLDDLSFVFIETVKKLQPKVVIMENVEGLLLGTAWSYVQRIYTDFQNAGYKLHHWLLEGERMGVPQTRHRVFFIAVREDLLIDPQNIDLAFNYKKIIYGDFKTDEEKQARGKMHEAIKLAKADEKVSDVMKRIYGKESGLTHRIARNKNVFPTQTGDHGDIWTESGNHPSTLDVLHASTFPEDYNLFGGKAEYICGMSVPPIMIKRIVTRLIEQGVFSETSNQ